MKQNNINIEDTKYHVTKMQKVTDISTPTRRWLIGLAMIQDVRDYISLTRLALNDQGFPVKDYDKELIEATTELQRVVNKYLTDQINMSILGIGDDSRSDTVRI